MKNNTLFLFLIFLSHHLSATHKVKFIVEDRTSKKGEAIYIAGEFNNWDTTANPKYRLRPNGLNENVIELNLKDGLTDFRFRRGGKSKSEVKMDDSWFWEREFMLKNDTTIRVIVREWKDELNKFRSEVLLSPELFNGLSDTEIGKINCWIFKNGNDPNWAKKEIDTKGWRKLKPTSLNKNMADKNNKLKN